MKILDKNTKKAEFDVNLKELAWVKAKEFIGKTVIVDAIGVNRKSKYGAQAFLVAGSIGINLPKYLVDTIEDILTDDESVQAIKDGLIVATFTEYQPKNGNSSTVELSFALKK